MIDALLGLPPHSRERLASALETGLLPAQPGPAAIRGVLGGALPDGAAAALAQLSALGVSGTAAAQWIRSLSTVEGKLPQIDLVWSGPEVPGLHARDTRRVYDELLGSAKQSLWITTYAFFDGPKAFASLARRMDALPSLRVMLLLNIQRKRGDTTAPEQLVRRFADRFWRDEWPGTSRPDVFYDPRALDPEHPSGVLHAKTVVADEEIVFVTSANLTEAALDRNIELGLRVRDRALALSISAHFRVLIERGLLLPLPGE